MSPFSLGILGSAHVPAAGGGSLTGAYLAAYNSTSTVNVGSSYTFTGVGMGDADAARTIVLVVRLGSSTTIPTVGSATVGGVAATVHVESVGARIGLSIISAQVPSGTTGDVVVTVGGAQATGCQILAWRIVGAVASVDTAADRTTAVLEGEVTATAGAFVIAGSSYRFNGSYTWANVTERQGLVGSIVTTGADAEMPSAGNVTPTITWGATADGALVVASFNP